MVDTTPYPVIDLFAGPGGLGEGFGALKTSDDSSYVFHTALSIEKERAARETLKLRHFFRSFAPGTAPDDYYGYLEGRITLQDLYRFHLVQAEQAETTAWKCELGSENHDEVKARIHNVVKGQAKWVLVGGPPCQAYSNIGRSRMKSRNDFEDDPRHSLYREYLRILADHSPPVFVMENVVGLTSAKLKGESVIQNIVRDLQKPRSAIYGEKDETGYTLYSLSQAGAKNLTSDPKCFVVKAEDYGIPQARHRVFIVGIRDNIQVQPRTLSACNRKTVRDVIGDLPELRSGVSGVADNEETWHEAIEHIREAEWYKEATTSNSSLFKAEADNFLKKMSESELQTRSTQYSPSETLPEWYKDDRLKVLISHVTRSHQESDLHRYFFAAIYTQVCGRSPLLQNFPYDLLPQHKNVQAANEKGSDKKQYVFKDRFRVQLPDAPATTVTSHISKDGHYFIHYDPSQCRSLTVREAARLQTFPDNYKFEGNRTEQYQQVGNAVPPLLAVRIAEVIRDVLGAIE